MKWPASSQVRISHPSPTAAPTHGMSPAWLPLDLLDGLQASLCSGLRRAPCSHATLRSLATKRHKKSAPGFSLLSTLVILFLATGVLLLVYLQVAHLAAAAHNLDCRLYATSLAQSGIEYAKALLRSADVQQLLEGSDGQLSTPKPAEWRNPMPFSRALTLEPSETVVGSDDGWPSKDGRLLLQNGYTAEGNGRFFLRFSNNPEEDGPDLDSVVLVRSMGIVHQCRTSPLSLPVKNAVAMIEARLRQEPPFFFPGALTIFSDEVQLSLTSTALVRGSSERPGIALLTPTGQESVADLADSIGPSSWDRITGAGLSPSIEEATSRYVDDSRYRRLLRSELWTQFLEELDNFAAPIRQAQENRDDPNLYVVPPDQTLRGRYRGAVVVSGDLTMAGDSEIEGILLHIGRGRLVFRDRARVIGGVWLSSVSLTPEVTAGPVSVQLLASAEIRFEETALAEARSVFPTTLLGWRLLFPD